MIKERQNKCHKLDFICICELLNVMTVGINFWITDIFLSRKFSNYGSSVIQYHMLSDSEQESIRNPRCNVFPTTVSFIKKKILQYFYNFV